MGAARLSARTHTQTMRYNQFDWTETKAKIECDVTTENKHKFKPTIRVLAANDVARDINDDDDDDHVS